MSETIGWVPCQRKGCDLAAEFKVDKRNKYFIVCSRHGRWVGSTNESQVELQRMLDSGGVSATPEEVTGEVVDTNTTVETQSGGGDLAEAAGKDEVAAGEVESGPKPLVGVLLLGFFGGAVLWLRRRKTRAM